MKKLLVFATLVVLCFLIGFFAAFINLTEVDAAFRDHLRAVMPQGWQERLRPLRAPVVIGFTPRFDATDVLPTTPIAITFLTSMNRELTERNISIEPRVEGEFSWEDETLTFTPKEGWPLGAEVRVTVKREARSSLLRRMESESTFHFNVLGPPTIVETEPIQEAKYTYLRDRLSITFNREMERASVESRLFVTPEIPRQRLGWEANQLVISGALQPSTEYRIAILSGAVDAEYGMAMEEDFVWTFTTTERFPYISIVGVGRYGLVEADKPVQLKLEMVNVSRVDLALYAIDVPTYIEMKGFSFDDWRHYRPEAEPIQYWSIEPTAAIDEVERQTLELGELASGLYYLTAKTPEDPSDVQVLVASHSALTLKRTAREVLVWATEMGDGEPIADLPLSVYNDEGELLAEGHTDGEGIFAGDIPETEGLLHVVAQREGDIGVCSDDWQEGIEPWRFEGVLWQWEMKAREHKVFVYTDRPLYRPGHKVRFKGIVRRDEDGRYFQPPEGTSVRVTAANWQENVLYKKTLETTAFGSIADEFFLNEEVDLGEYYIKTEIDGEEYFTTFRIEEYRKPEYLVSVEMDRDAYINGDEISAKVHASYYFGGPVAGARVHYTLYSNDYYFYWAGGDFDFGDIPSRRYWGYGREVASGDGVTDENGDFEVTLMADISREERSQVFTLEAMVTDPSEQPVSGLDTALVHRGTFYIGLRPEGYVAEKGEKTYFDVQTVDTEGQPQGGIALDYTIYLVEWRRYERKREGQVYWEWEEIKTGVASGELTTDGQGEGTIAFTPPRGGSYRLEARGYDERDNRVLGTTHLWVSDREVTVGWRFGNHDRIELILDKRRYLPGETAQVLVQSPYPQARALVTIERGRIINHRLIALESNSTIVEVPVERDYFPNVFVSVVLIPKGGFGDEYPSFKVGYAEIRVESEEQKLIVSVASDKDEYRPRDEATYTIRTTDHLGEPLSAEVSLGVVDAAIYALAGEVGPDIVEAFYGRRQLAVRTASSLSVHVQRVYLRRDYGGGGPAEGEARRFFPDVAYWNPIIETDGNGLAEVSFPMPDSLTTWRATAWGVTADTKVGSASDDAVVTKDLILRPILPRFLTIGDEARIGAIVHNRTGEAVEAEVSLSATGLALPPDLKQTVVIEDGQLAKVSWAVTSPLPHRLPAVPTFERERARQVTAEMTSSTTITMWAVTPRASDGVELTLPVLPFGEKSVLADAGEVEEMEVRTIELPEDAIFSTLAIDVSHSLAAGLVDSLDFLTGYPYGCVEQTMSRFLPDVLVKQTLDRLGIENEELERELPKMVEDGLQRLYRFQRWDGGWGWWEGDEVSSYQTAYVVYGLNEAEKAGFAVDANVLQRGIEALRTPLQETEDLNLKAYILYVLTNCGEEDISLARSLFDRRGGMDPYAQAYLAMALNLLGDSTKAEAIVEKLAGEAAVSATMAHWEEREHCWEMMSSDGRTTALILQAMVALEPDNPLIPKAVRWLMRARLGGYWRTTQETAATIIALTDYLAVSGELEADYNYRVYVNGHLVGEGMVDRDNIAEHHEFVISDLALGDNEVKIVKEGKGRLYFATTLRYYQERYALEPARSLDGPIIHRDYLDPETDEPLTEYRVGDLIRVKLTLELPDELWYMIIEDPLPAGCEAVNYTLRTSGVRKGEYEYYWSHPELRDEKAVFFTTYMWEGVHEYSYLIRVTTPGHFRAMPAEVTPMYEPDIWGRSASAVFEIEE